MKWFLIILSAYILSLACIPCADAKSADMSKELVSQQQDHFQHIDSCTPFCICNCCGSQIFNSTVLDSFNIEKSIPTIGSKIIEYQFDFSSHFFASIWQPPQL